MDKPRVSIVMGSDSDLLVMMEAGEVLEEFNVSFEFRVISAHRTPDKSVDYARSAPTRGIEVIIAGAGGAAHLPGVIAALTPLPVIGVPIRSKSLDGMDSLLSIVQMPPGIPVATVGIDAARNAALLALRILATHDMSIREAYDKFSESMRTNVDEKDQLLLKKGFKAYLEGMK